jgi:hypothetical protein
MVWPIGGPDLTTCASSLLGTAKEKISQLHLTIFEAPKPISEAALMTSSVHYGKRCQDKHGEKLKFVRRM